MSYSEPYAAVADLMALEPEPGYVRCFIGLGSNLNNPVQQLQSACLALDNLAASTVLCCSRFYISQPLQQEDDTSLQPEYVNAVLALDTRLSPGALLEAMLEIEAAQGRVRDGRRWAPRILDLDLLLYGKQVLDDDALIIPHPGLAEREFVLYPLYEIAPRCRLPDGRFVRDLVKACPRRGLAVLERVCESAES